MNICLLTFVGLPASGKTTIANKLVENCTQYKILHICYDNYIRFENNLKAQRRDLLEKIDSLVKDIKEETNFTTFFQSNIKGNKNSSNLLILIDDNNYYRGMRYQIFQICRKYSISFGQIFFDTSLQLAIERNRDRESRVPDEIIMNMCSRLESPFMKNKWETNSFVIHSENIDNINISDIFLFIQKCFDNPEKYRIVFEQPKTEQSEIHKFDIVLRKEISRILKETYFNNRNEKSFFASKLNDKRKSLLDECKSGVLQLSDYDDMDLLNLLSTK